MFNKFYKTIHKKFSRVFQFIFFLRYLFAIFFITIAISLIIPNFFNYEKRAQVIKSYLLKNYNIRIDEYKKISFESLPLPKIKLENVLVNLNDKKSNLKVQNLNIYPKLFSIYNYQDFETNKIILKNSKIFIEASEFNSFTQNFLKQKKKIILNNLELNIFEGKNSIINFKNIKFANFGYNKNLISGVVFEKKFKIKIENDLQNIDFKLLNSGVTANVNLYNKSKPNLISGVLKSKILNTNFKSNFDFNSKKVILDKYHLRNNNLS